MLITEMETDKLIPYTRNPRNNKGAVAKVAASIKEYGFRQPIVVDGEMVVVAGHTRLAAAWQLGLGKVPVHIADNLSDTQIQAYRIMDNRSHEEAEWDDELLGIELADLSDQDFDLDLTGFSAAEIEQLMNDESLSDITPGGGNGELARKFLVPPFSVLDTRMGYWQDRKRAWNSIGIESRDGRDENLIGHSPLVNIINAGTSTFDPVLCELVYLWFSNKENIILDPFSGGSVRGIVASKLERNYIGMDLSKRQIETNRGQAKNVCESHSPVWNVGDSRKIDLLEAEADLVFSCPPYHNLEVYSEDDKDISNMDWEEFLPAYREIISKSVGMLKDDRFACFVVSEIRDKKTGLCRNFVDETKKAFQDAGAFLYNDAVLINVAGTLPIRTPRHFKANRKMGRMHQNVLVFVKGDPVKATENAGEIEVAEMEEMFGEINELAEAEN